MVDIVGDDLPVDFGKYRLEKRIATGGMAEIFLAHRHDEPMEPVVIKRILPHLTKSADFVQMFLDEARVAANIKHTNVVQVLDVGQVDGAYYLALEYVHGEDIRRIYNRAYHLQRSLPLSHSIRVIADAALGLGHAHDLRDIAGRPMNIVHRDVSPQNILVTYDGDAKVVDFGIAKAINKVARTRDGVLKGKYSYMSPEQALGEPIDHKTDIFALGIILYETTTGTRLFKRENELATLQAIIKCEFVPPSEALPNYPPELEKVLLKALTKDKRQRWDSAEDLSAALYDFLYDSSLYVERDVIAGFMADLFEDRLEEEEVSGVPALPDEDEVRQELGEPQTSAERPSRRRVTSIERGGDEDEGPTPGFSDEGGEGTAPEGDFEGLAAGARFLPTSQERPGAPPEPPDPTEEGRAADIEDPAERPRRRGSTQVLPEPVDRKADTHLDPSTAPDEAPTVAVPSYRPESVAPETNAGPRKKQESTERVVRAEPRAEIPASERTEDEAPEGAAAAAPAARSGRGPLLLVAALVAAVLAAVVTGVVVSRLLSGPDPAAPDEAPGLVADRGEGEDEGRDDAAGADPEALPPLEKKAVERTAELTVYTEPGAEVFFSGEHLGTADADGVAGPFSVKSGETLVRVSVASKGFERQRPLSVEPGQNYQFEIRGRTGWLRLAVAPWARVKVDGKDMGLTPLSRIPLLEGVHDVILENPNIERRYKGVVRILPNKETLLKVNLNESGESL